MVTGETYLIISVVAVTMTAISHNYRILTKIWYF